MTDKERLYISELEGRVQQYVSEIKHLEFKNATLQTQINKLQAEAYNEQSLKRQAHRLYGEVDSRILRAIDRRGYARRPAKVRTPVEVRADEFESQSLDQLLGLARNYDSQAFFRLHTPKSGMKLRYRVLSKTYRTSRDLSVKGLKTGYNLAKRSRGRRG